MTDNKSKSGTMLSQELTAALVALVSKSEQSGGILTEEDIQVAVMDIDIDSDELSDLYDAVRDRGIYITTTGGADGLNSPDMDFVDGSNGCSDADMDDAEFDEDGMGKEGFQLGDFIEDHTAVDPFEAASDSMLREQLDQALNRLSDLECKIIKYRYGLEDGHPHTLEEVARECGITRNRALLIERKALKVMLHLGGRPTGCQFARFDFRTEM